MGEFKYCFTSGADGIKVEGNAQNVVPSFFMTASSLFLGFLTFEPPLLGLLRKGDCLSRIQLFNYQTLS